MANRDSKSNCRMKGHATEIGSTRFPVEISPSESVQLMASDFCVCVCFLITRALGIITIALAWGDFGDPRECSHKWHRAHASQAQAPNVGTYQEEKKTDKERRPSFIKRKAAERPKPCIQKASKSCQILH